MKVVGNSIFSHKLQKSKIVEITFEVMKNANYLA